MQWHMYIQKMEMDSYSTALNVFIQALLWSFTAVKKLRRAYYSVRK